MQSRVQSLVAEGLTERGYVLTPERADLIIRVGAGRRAVTVQEATPPEGDQSEMQEPHFDYQEVDGSLVIDALDGLSRARIWLASSRTEVDPARIDQPELRRSVTALLASFPHAPTAPTQR